MLAFESVLGATSQALGFWWLSVFFIGIFAITLSVDVKLDQRANDMEALVLEAAHAKEAHVKSEDTSKIPEIHAPKSEIRNG